MTQRDPLQAVLDQLAELTRRLDATDDVVAEHAAKLADPQQRAYKPEPTVPWWQLGGTDRDEFLTRLRRWIDHVYQPSYGHLAARLPGCWEDHDLCLFILDWLIELWSTLYVPVRRTQRIVAGQAEFTTRILPAAAELMAAEAVGCAHSKPRQPHLNGSRP
jgi:hypothetical protein